MAELRRDAARNRSRVLDAARALQDAGEPLQFNSIARAAEVGVGTVYRNFATVAELDEALVLPRFAEMEALAAAAAASGAARRVETFLEGALATLVTDHRFAAVATQPVLLGAEASEARARLVRVIGELLDGAREAGDFRTEVSSPDLLVLLCGLAYAVRRSHADPARSRRYLEILLRGLTRGS